MYAQADHWIKFTLKNYANQIFLFALSSHIGVFVFNMSCHKTLFFRSIHPPKRFTFALYLVSKARLTCDIL
jgi:hypothetical protein